MTGAGGGVCVALTVMLPPPCFTGERGGLPVCWVSLKRTQGQNAYIWFHPNKHHLHQQVQLYGESRMFLIFMFFLFFGLISSSHHSWNTFSLSFLFYVQTLISTTNFIQVFKQERVWQTSNTEHVSSRNTGIYTQRSWEKMSRPYIMTFWSHKIYYLPHCAEVFCTLDLFNLMNQYSNWTNLQVSHWWGVNIYVTTACYS